jgi:glycosyltransferase involved in cell wall biosynthesis
MGDGKPLIPDLSNLRISILAGTLAQGGSERQLFYMARSLARAGAATQVLSLTKGEFWQDKIEAAGVPVHWVGQERSQLARLRAIVAEVRRFRPSVLQSQHFYTNPYVLLAARWLGVAELGAIRSATLWAVARKSAYIRRFSLLRLRHIAANSQQSIREAIEIGVRPDRLTLVPNVIDTSVFYPVVRPLDAPVELLSVGRLGPEKRQDIFLNVLARARARSASPLTGRIVGDGPLRQALEKQASALGLTPETAVFSGAVADMPTAYHGAGIFVLSSDHEGSPNVVLEAMACGLPVVATRVGGVPDLVEHGRTGLICPPGDEEAICEAVLRLTADPRLRRQMGERARMVAEERHSDTLLPSWLRDLYGVAMP